jgi:hypothetical protein
MKLLIITAIAAFDKTSKKNVETSWCKTFSYKEVTGFKDISEESMENWFGSEMSETVHTVLCLCDNGNVDIDRKVNEFNTPKEEDQTFMWQCKYWKLIKTLKLGEDCFVSSHNDIMKNKSI